MACNRATRAAPSRSRPRPNAAACGLQSPTAASPSCPARMPTGSTAFRSACTRFTATTRASSWNGCANGERAPRWRFRMKPPTAVIAEDEPLLRSELRETLAALWPELVVAAEAEDGLEAMRALQAHRPQLLFLDIEMPGMTG